MYIIKFINNISYISFLGIKNEQKKKATKKACGACDEYCRRGGYQWHLPPPFISLSLFLVFNHMMQ